VSPYFSKSFKRSS